MIYTHIHDICSMDLLDMTDYKSSNNNGYRYILVIIDKFSKHAWTVPLRNKYGQTIKDEFSNILLPKGNSRK